MGLTKKVLKRPVTTVLVVLCLIVFGLSSIFSSQLELIPEMDMPMLIVSAVYPGASPDDVDQLVISKIEDEIGTLSGVDSVTSMSSENFGMVLVQYDYDQDIDKAYDDLKKKLDGIKSDLPDDVDTPTIIEMDINSTPSITLAVNNDSVDNLYNYVNDDIVPEIEKLTSVASVDVSGGQEAYIKAELIPEKLSQYHVNMNTIVAALKSADFSMPIGSTSVGNKDLSVTSGTSFDTMELLKKIPITLGNGNIIYMEDVANIYNTVEAKDSIGRYDGKDTMTIGVKKNQDSDHITVSKAVQETMQTLKAQDPSLEYVVVNDYSDQISNSLNSVFQTMIMAVIVAMLIIWLFFGDIKASLIVGTSIPVSILAALILMKAIGFTLNVITLSSLVLGVGMMVDNSIVVLESCDRWYGSRSGIHHRWYRYDMCRIYPVSPDLRNERTDVQAVGLHDRILYDRVPDLRDDACTALLRVLPSEGEGKYPGLRHHESSAERIPFPDGEAFKEKSDGHGNRRCACDLLPVPCDKVKDRAYAGR